MEKELEHRSCEVRGTKPMRVDMRAGKRPRFKLITLFLFWSLILVSLAEASLGERVFEKVLPNGLKILLLENTKAPVVTFQVWYRVGSRNERCDKTGLSHLLEHMMFKGTERIGPEAFSRIIQENGGNYNAFTSYDFTAYFENLSADRIQVALDLESDRMQNLVLREQDFQTERKVVMEERRLRTEDNPKSYLMEQLAATAFQRHPYRWPIIGWMEDLARLTLEDLKAYYTAYYNPANAFVVVVGDFKKDDLLPQIEKAFGSIPKGLAPNQDRDIDPPQRGERRLIVKREAQLPFLAMAFHVPNLLGSDSYVLEVIGALLSEGKSSRLYQSLVQEKRLALSAEADHSLLSRDPGLFLIAVEPLPGQEPHDVEETVEQELERLQEQPVGEHELEKAKNQLETSYIFGQDSLFFQAMLLARYEIAHTWRAIDDYVPSIRSVTPEDIRRVARRYLIADNRTVATLIPLPRGEGKPKAEEFSIRTEMIQ
jgi:zinc protease